MLPRKCSQPPCRNIDVKSVSQLKCAGTSAKARRNAGISESGIDSSKRNATALETMRAMVTNGKVRVWMTSRSGIMRGIVTYNQINARQPWPAAHQPLEVCGGCRVRVRLRRERVFSSRLGLSSEFAHALHRLQR